MMIKPVPINDVLTMRQAVMYPNESVDFVKLEDDDKGLHWGLYVNDELISVISVFEREGSVQFRKFATRDNMQGRGYGSKLLQYVMDWATEHNKQSVWCNARASATALYVKFGMQPTGAPWQKWGIDFIKMEKKLFATNGTPDRTTGGDETQIT